MVRIGNRLQPFLVIVLARIATALSILGTLLGDLVGIVFLLIVSTGFCFFAELPHGYCFVSKLSASRTCTDVNSLRSICLANASSYVANH